jgi:hypothetical protein
MSRTAERPAGDSDTWRHAARADSALAGRKTPRSSSPRRSTLRRSPVTKPVIGTRRSARAREPAAGQAPPSGAQIVATPSRAAVRAIIGPAGRDRQMLPPTVATFCTLNEPSRASAHWRGSDRPAGQSRPGAGCQRASSASVQVAEISRPSPVSVSAGQP